ncbi:MAG: phospholipase A [Mariprofundus sp.]
MSIFILLTPGIADAEILSEPDSKSHVETRLEMEQDVENNGFAILPHKPNYILLANYNSRPNQAPWQSFGAGSAPVKKTEIKFQVSIKVPLVKNLLTNDDTLFVGYTQKSFWQAYNRKVSSPFRDNNFNPEIFYRMRLDQDFLGWKARILTFGFEHESNGRAEPLSRSWNRIYGFAAAERGNLTLGLKAWYRIPESASSDNNPDITRFMGHSELYAYYKSGGHTLGIMFRPAFYGGFRHGLQLDWSFPLLGKLHGYVQYYNGYGESLIDYNHYNNSIGVGFILSNWL